MLPPNEMILGVWVPIKVVNFLQTQDINHIFHFYHYDDHLPLYFISIKEIQGTQLLKVI